MTETTLIVVYQHLDYTGRRFFFVCLCVFVSLTFVCRVGSLISYSAKCLSIFYRVLVLFGGLFSSLNDVCSVRRPESLGKKSVDVEIARAGAGASGAASAVSGVVAVQPRREPVVQLQKHPPKKSGIPLVVFDENLADVYDFEDGQVFF